MIIRLCDLTEVSKSSFYDYLKSKDERSERERNDIQLKNIILKTFNYRGYKSSSRSIKMVLKQEFSMITNRKSIQRIMLKYNIKCPIRKANPYYRMIKSTREHTVVPNLLNR